MEVLLCALVEHLWQLLALAADEDWMRGQKEARWSLWIWQRQVKQNNVKPCSEILGTKSGAGKLYANASCCSYQHKQHSEFGVGGEALRPICFWEYSYKSLKFENKKPPPSSSKHLKSVHESVSHDLWRCLSELGNWTQIQYVLLKCPESPVHSLQVRSPTWVLSWECALGLICATAHPKRYPKDSS